MILFFLFFGLLNALILSVFFFVKRNSKASFWLAMLMLDVGLELMNYSLFPMLKGHFPFLICGFPGVYLLAPFLFFYYRSYTHPEVDFKPKDWLLLVPFFVVMVYYITKITWIYVNDLEHIEFYFDANRSIYMQSDFIVRQGLAIVFSLAVLVEIWKRINRELTFFRDFFSKKNPHLVHLKFLTAGMLLGLFVWLGYEVFEIIQYPTPLDPFLYNPLRLWLVALFLTTGFMSIDVKPHPLVEPDDRKYKTYQISEEKKDVIVLRIEQAIVQDRLYLNPELRLLDLTQKTGIPEHHISQTFSSVFKVTFSDYINRLRIEEVKKRLISDDYQRQTLLGIAMGCGFNSKSTFNASFKKFAGMTPSAYKKNTKNSAY